MPRASRLRRKSNELWRVGAWGGIAALMLAMSTFATQIKGWPRVAVDAEQKAAPVAVPLDNPPPPQILQEVERQKQIHTLEDQVHELTEERSQLNERVATLEKQLKDVTGAIQKQVNRMSEMPAQAETNVPNANMKLEMPKFQGMDNTSGSSSAISVIDPLAMGVMVPHAKEWPERILHSNASMEKEETHSAASVIEQPKEATPRTPNQQLAALPAGEAPPLPSARFIESPPKPPNPALDELPIKNQQYGIELATGTDVGALRDKWSAIKANIGPLLTGLQPVAVYDRQKKGDVYHLILGPLPSLISAHQLCARFSAARIACRPSHFDGQAIVQQ